MGDDLVERLKPCPFCGEPAKMIEDRDYRSNLPNGSWFAICHRCDVMLDFDQSEEAATARWNTRSESTTLQQQRREIDGLQARIDAVRKVIVFGFEPPGVNPLKNGEKCEHDMFEWEDCVACYDTALLAALDSLSTPDNLKGGG